MRRLLLVGAALVGALALAGQQGKDSTGAAPTPLGPSAQAERQGVPLTGAVGCRMSIRVDGGGNVAAGCVLVPWYYDSTLGWVESASSLHCTTTATLDGGARDNYVCPDLTPAARFGRVALQKVYCVGADGGTGSASSSDGGILAAPVTRIECWGPGVSGI